MDADTKVKIQRGENQIAVVKMSHSPRKKKKKNASALQSWPQFEKVTGSSEGRGRKKAESYCREESVQLSNHSPTPQADFTLFLTAPRFPKMYQM